MFGSWPIATNRPCAGISCSLVRVQVAEPHARSSGRRRATTSSTTVGVTNSIFSFARARSIMIGDARNSSRRWTSVTLVANFVRKIASSIAESPPPTTTTSLSRKKAASQTAQ